MALTVTGPGGTNTKTVPNYITVTAAADTQAPSVPSGLTGTATSSTSVSLTWNASTDNVGVTGYRVFRCEGTTCTNFAQVGAPTGTTFTNTGLNGGTVYRFAVKAIDAAGNLSAYSTTVNVTTPAGADTTPPSVPSGLTGTATGSTSVSLSWTASTDNVGVTGYRVFRCEGSTCTNFAQVGAPTGTTFTNTGLNGGTVYRYAVKAIDAAGNLSAYSTTANVTTPAGADTTPPTAPSGLTATAGGSSSVNLSWAASTDNVGVTGYRVERCTSAGCSNFAQIATPTGTTFSNSGLAGSTSYSYRVRAIDAAGNLSAYSAVASATTARPAGRGADCELHGDARLGHRAAHRELHEHVERNHRHLRVGLWRRHDGHSSEPEQGLQHARHLHGDSDGDGPGRIEHHHEGQRHHGLVRADRVGRHALRQPDECVVGHDRPHQHRIVGLGAMADRRTQGDRQRQDLELRPRGSVLGGHLRQRPPRPEVDRRLADCKRVEQ